MPKQNSPSENQFFCDDCIYHLADKTNAEVHSNLFTAWHAGFKTLRNYSHGHIKGKLLGGPCFVSDDTSAGLETPAVPRRIVSAFSSLALTNKLAASLR
jgi:hypothetical protein